MDWLFQQENRVCHVRVAGVLIQNGKLFVQKLADKEEYALPGGHLQFGETTEEALVREFQEETGARIVCNRLLWTEENFWTWGQKSAHGIHFYYLVDLLVDSRLPDSFVPMRDNANVLFGWVSTEDLADKNIYPRYLITEIHNLTDTPKHFIQRDG